MVILIEKNTKFSSFNFFKEFVFLIEKKTEKLCFEKKFRVLNFWKIAFEIFLMFKINKSSLRSVSNCNGLWNCNPKEYSCSIDEMQHLFKVFDPGWPIRFDQLFSQWDDEIENLPDIIIFCCDWTNGTFIF